MCLTRPLSLTILHAALHAAVSNDLDPSSSQGDPALNALDDHEMAASTGS